MTETPPQKSAVELLEINEFQAGQRIDNFLMKHLKDVPRSHIYRIVRSGQVRINKGRIKQTYKLQIGDILRVPPLVRQAEDAPQIAPKYLSQKLHEHIIYEDKHLLVLNKPSGIAVHGGSGIQFGVIEGLRALYPKLPYLELVHRLDRDTSGCLLLAKKPAMLRYLHACLREHRIEKRYITLLQGAWPQRLRDVSAPLRKSNRQSGERIVRVDSQGKTAESRFTVLQRIKLDNTDLSFMQVKLKTGRTHQIRVHAKHIGHPVAGDEKYGDNNFNQKMRSIGIKRLFLHSDRVQFILPESNEILRLEAPLSPDLQRALDDLQK